VLFGQKLSEVQYYYMVAALMVVSLVVVHRILKSNLGRAFEALRDSPIASDCMGVSVYRYKVCLHHQRRFRGPGRQPVCVFGGVHLAQYLQLRADHPVPAGRDHGRPQDRSGSLIGALIVVMLPSLLADIELFRQIAVAAAVLGVIGSALMLAKRAPPCAACGAAGGDHRHGGVSYKLENIVDWRLTIFGLMTLFVVYYLQDGIVGFLQSLMGRGASMPRRRGQRRRAVPARQGGKAGDTLLSVDRS
jgi:branched-chain amino acid transport system permease protein